MKQTRRRGRTVIPMKRVYRVKWPDGNVELIAAENDEELLCLLEEEGSPFDAEIEEVELDTVRINLKNRLRTFREIMELPVRRKLKEFDLDRALAQVYGISRSVYYH